MTERWTFNGYELDPSDVVPGIDGDHEGLAMALLVLRTTRRDLGGMAEFAGRIREYQPPGEATLVVDGSPNGENLVAIRAPDRVENLALDGWYLWDSFNAKAEAGLADRVDLRATFRMVAGPNEADGVVQSTVNLLNNDFGVGTSPANIFVQGSE